MKNTQDLYHKEFKRLSPNEVKELFKQYTNGDKEAGLKLIVNNIPFVKYIIRKKFSDTLCDQDDLISEGNIGLIKAVKSYDQNKKINFLTYAEVCINNQILMFINKYNKYENRKDQFATLVSYETKEKTSELSNIRYIDIKDNLNIIEDYEKQINRIKIINILEKLSTKEQILILLRYGFIDDKTITSYKVGVLLGFSQSYEVRLQKKIITKLSIYLSQEQKLDIKRLELKLKKIDKLNNNNNVNTLEKIPLILSILQDKDIDIVKNNLYNMINTKENNQELEIKKLILLKK